MGNRDALRAKNKQLQKERLNTQNSGPETQVDEILKGVAAEAKKQEQAKNPEVKPEIKDIKESVNTIEIKNEAKILNNPEIQPIEEKQSNIKHEIKEESQNSINGEINNNSIIQEKTTDNPTNMEFYDTENEQNTVLEDIKERVSEAEKELKEDEEILAEVTGKPAKAAKTAKTKAKKADEIKKTSLNISRSSLAYLAVNSKLQKINQNTLLSMIIKEEQDKKIKYKIDYNLVPTKTTKANTTIKAVQLPESQLDFLKSVSAIKMKSVSEFVDQLIQNKILEEDN